MIWNNEGFHSHGGTPIYGWLIRDNPVKRIFWGYPHVWQPPPHIWIANTWGKTCHMLELVHDTCKQITDLHQFIWAELRFFGFFSPSNTYLYLTPSKKWQSPTLGLLYSPHSEPTYLERQAPRMANRLKTCSPQPQRSPKTTVWYTCHQRMNKNTGYTKLFWL